MRLRIDLGVLLLVAVAAGCAYVEDKSAAPHQRKEQGGPVLPPVADGKLRPLSANFALFEEASVEDEDPAYVEQHVIRVADGDRLQADSLVAGDHVEVTFALDADDLGGERAIRGDFPPGVEITSDKCFDFRPTHQNTHGCIVVIKAPRQLPAGTYKITLAYNIDPDRSLAFTVED